MALVWVWVSGLAVCVLLHCSCIQVYTQSFVGNAMAPEIVLFQARLPYISVKVNVPLSQGDKVWKVNVILTNCSLRWDYTGCQELWEHSGGKRKLLEYQPSNMPSNVVLLCIFCFFTPRAVLCQFLLLRISFFFFWIRLIAIFFEATLVIIRNWNGSIYCWISGLKIAVSQFQVIVTPSFLCIPSWSFLLFCMHIVLWFVSL